MSRPSYKCIECGSPTNEIFAFKNGSKISQCPVCESTVDKYFECDNIHVTLDLLLLKAPAFRHVLFNLPLKSGVLKMWVFMLFSDAYFKWWNSSGGKTDSKEKYLDFSKLELQFYSILLQVLLQNILFYLVLGVALLCLLPIMAMDCNVKTFFKALLFGKFAKLYVFAVYIWTESTEVSVCIMLLECYIFICRYTFILCAISVESKFSLFSLVLLVICALIEYNFDRVVKLSLIGNLYSDLFSMLHI